MQHNKQPINNSFNGSSDHYPEGFNPDDYKTDLDATELSPEDIEILLTLWNIMKHFVDLGWGVDNVQLALPDLFQTDKPDSVNAANDNKGASNE